MTGIFLAYYLNTNMAVTHENDGSMFIIILL